MARHSSEAIRATLRMPTLGPSNGVAADAAMGRSLSATRKELAELEALMGAQEEERKKQEEELARANLSATPMPPVLAPHDWDFVGACFFCFPAATTKSDSPKALTSPMPIRMV